MSKLIKCPACNHEVSMNAQSCPNCGEPFFKKKKSRGCFLFIVFFLIGALGVVITVSVKHNSVPDNVTIAPTPIPKKKVKKKVKVTNKASKKKVCDEIRLAYLKTVDAGASLDVLSKGAHDLYSIVSLSGQGSHCSYLRYAFRTLKKPYNGDNISQRDLDESIKMIRNRTEY